MPVAQARKISPLPWCAVEPVRASPSPTRRASRAQAGPVERGVGDHDADARPGRRRRAAGTGRGAAAGRPGRRRRSAASRSPKFVISSTATVCPDGSTRDAVPMPPLKPRQRHPGPAAHRALVRRQQRADRRPRRVPGRPTSPRVDLHPPGVVEERVVALADDRDHDVLADAAARSPAAARRPRRRPGRAASSRSGRPASRAGPTRRRRGSPVHSPAPLSTAPPAGTGRANASSAGTSTVTPVRATPRPRGGSGSSRQTVACPSPTPGTSRTEFVGPVGRVADPDAQVSSARHGWHPAAHRSRPGEDARARVT